MIEQFSNFAISALASALSGSGTNAAVVSAAAFPAAPQFRITVQDSPSSAPEIMLVTAVSGNTFTVTRGYEGSTISAHAAGAQVSNDLTAGLFRNVYPNGAVETAVGPYSFDGSLPVMEINPATPAASTVNIITASLVPFRLYTITDGSNTAYTNPITIIPDAGLINNGNQYQINTNSGAVTFYWNGTGIRFASCINS